MCGQNSTHWSNVPHENTLNLLNKLVFARRAQPWALHAFSSPSFKLPLDSSTIPLRLCETHIRGLECIAWQNMQRKWGYIFGALPPVDYFIRVCAALLGVL